MNSSSIDLQFCCSITFYEKKVMHLKKSNSKQWYKQLKMMTKYDQREDKPEVDSLKHLSDVDQAEAIANKFQEIANEYEPLNAADVTIPPFSDDDILVITEAEVQNVLENLKLNKSERKTDIPAKQAVCQEALYSNHKVNN